MNLHLQKLFSKFYNALDTNRDNSVGASSIEGTEKLRGKMIKIFKKYHIKKIFDAGCNDCEWTRTFDQDDFKYLGGDISLSMISKVWVRSPHLNVILHDITSDPIPDVDVLFVRDVTLHLNNSDRMLVLKNWINSSVPWLMITHSPHIRENTDIVYDNGFPASEVNWCLPPWNFPQYTDCIWEYSPGGRCMGLWHRDQIKSIV
jgi:hypothetical protein